MAVTPFEALIVTVHVPVPVHSPLQPANVDPPVGDGVNVTKAPDGNEALHADPQLIPAGAEVTVPDPVPAFVTVRITLAPAPA